MTRILNCRVEGHRRRGHRPFCALNLYVVNTELEVVAAFDKQLPLVITEDKGIQKTEARWRAIARAKTGQFGWERVSVLKHAKDISH